jgi:hexokinase
METHALFEKTLKIDTTEAERKLIRRLAELIGTRAARLSACGVAAICKMKGWTSLHVGADGSVFNKYPNFQKRGAQALCELFGWDKSVRQDPIQIVPSEDGSGVGAALIAALTMKRINAGIYAGVNDKRKNSLIPPA